VINPPLGRGTGDLDLNAVDKNAPAPPVAAAAPLVPGTIQLGKYSAPPPTAAALPTYTYIFAHGAFQMLGTRVDALVSMSTPPQFPDPGTLNVYRAILSYHGTYTDPTSGIHGYLYYGDFGPPMNERRWFLFGDRTAFISQADGQPLRYILYYNSSGQKRYQTLASYIVP
jgi:hypothetical protein